MRLEAFAGAVATIGAVAFVGWHVVDPEFSRVRTVDFTCELGDEPSTTPRATETVKVEWSRRKHFRESIERKGGLCEKHRAEPVTLIRRTTRICSSCPDENAGTTDKVERVPRGDLPVGATDTGEHTEYVLGIADTNAKHCKSGACRCMAKRGWSREVCETVAARQVFIGMTDAQCRVAWGAPDDINRTQYSNLVREQWVYGSGSYLYFVNGVLTTIQN